MAAADWEQPGDDEARLKAARDFVTRQGDTFSVVADLKGTLVKAVEASFPTVLVIDRGSRVRFRNDGYRAGEERILEEQIERLLSE